MTIRRVDIDKLQEHANEYADKITDAKDDKEYERVREDLKTVAVLELKK